MFVQKMDENKMTDRGITVKVMLHVQIIIKIIIIKIIIIITIIIITNG